MGVANTLLDRSAAALMMYEVINILELENKNKLLEGYKVIGLRYIVLVC